MPPARPSRREMNEGIGTIRLDFAAEVALSAAGDHQLSFRNDHLPELGVYLVNALVPTTDAIKITRQQRDALQHELRVDFGVSSTDLRVWPRWTAMLLFALCLALLLQQWKHLCSFFRAQVRQQISIQTEPEKKFGGR